MGQTSAKKPKLADVPLWWLILPEVWSITLSRDKQAEEMIAHHLPQTLNYNI